MTTLKTYEPVDDFKVPPEDRLFIWPDDMRRAIGDLNLVPA